MDAYTPLEAEKNKTAWCPLLQKIKREICHDKKKAEIEIRETIKDLADGRFHFLHLTPIEQLYTYGMDGYDVTRQFTEDIGILRYNNLQLISVLRSLLSWLKTAPDYQYPFEREIEP